MTTKFGHVALMLSLTLVALGATVLAPGASPEANSRGNAWWTAWSSCDITPVHNAPEQEAGPVPSDLAPIEFLPWLEAETTNASDATVVVSLWSGNRPLPVHGSYANGDNAKWLWILSDDLDDLKIAATNEKGTTVDFSDPGRVLSSSTGGNEWPSIIEVPEPGCWTFHISATGPDGDPYEGRIVFPAVP